MSKSFKAAMQQSVNIRPENWVNNFPDNQDQEKQQKGHQAATESYVTALSTQIWHPARLKPHSPLPLPIYVHNPVS